VLELVGAVSDSMILSVGVERPLAVLEIEEHAHARGDELLERVRRLDRLAAEARLLRHDEHLERRSGVDRVHQA
jgi:hypothetical protein